MTVAEFTAVVLGASIVAGLVGSLTGLGGGVIITPVLTLFLHVDLRYAIGASLVSVIATSSGAAAAYVRDGYSNIRIGMLLEVATTAGAICGAYIGTRVSSNALSMLFGFVLLQAAWQTTRLHHGSQKPAAADPLAKTFRLNSFYPTEHGEEPYEVRRVKTGLGLMFGAGTLSGLLGIGSGSLKVVAMDQAMQLPFKVSTATSNFMIGVTAAASASVYLKRGYNNPAVAMPVILGVLLGSLTGARLLPRLSVSLLRRIFAIVVGLLGIEMIANGIRGTA